LIYIIENIVINIANFKTLRNPNYPEGSSYVTLHFLFDIEPSSKTRAQYDAGRSNREVMH